MGLPGAGRVKVLIVHCPPWGAIMFGCDVHAGLPPYWGVQGDRFQHSQADVTLDPCKNCFMPVEGNCGRFVYRLWCGFRVDVKLQWWTVLQQRKGLVLTDVESRICIVV